MEFKKNYKKIAICAIIIGIIILSTIIYLTIKKLPDNKNVLIEDQSSLIAENILQSINEDNYSKFSEYFSDNVKKTMTNSEYQKLKGLILDSSGPYISKSSSSQMLKDGYELYIWNCEFKREKVIFSLSFKPTQNKIEGIWFDSTNLRKTNGLG
ncbi:MAG: DUF3887 domain-containing protein [Nanoarchaeota archaeon]|nr:DUF3887 domain-containing protein [Nanoarchaeota archaeon]